MAMLCNGKRKRNVRSSSSCSSVESSENNPETGYISDNSTSDVDTNPKYYQNGGKVGFSNSRAISLTNCNVLKKQFPLQLGKKLNDSDEGVCYEPSRKKPKCFNKNAVMARLNRMRKKEHLDSLERKVQELSEENNMLREQAKGHDDIVGKLNEEVNYLKSVLANSREISKLLKSVKSTGLPVTSSLKSVMPSSLSSKEEQTSFDCDFTEDPLLSCNFELLSDVGNLDQTFKEDLPSDASSSQTDFGICLHVSNKTVSLELCPTCHTNAITSWDKTS